MLHPKARLRRHPSRPRYRQVNAFTRWLLHQPAFRRLADRQVCELRFTGARSHVPIALPVMYAQHGERLVVLVGAAENKRWWRSFARPTRVHVMLRGVSRTGTGHLVAEGAAGRAEAAEIYRERFPHHAVEDDPMVVIALDP